MSELVFLRSKAYVFLVENKEAKKLKGITKTTVKNFLTFEDYENVLLNPYTSINYHKNVIFKFSKS